MCGRETVGRRSADRERGRWEGGPSKPHKEKPRLFSCLPLGAKLGDPLLIAMDPNVARLIERTRARRAGLKEGFVDGSPLPR